MEIKYFGGNCVKISNKKASVVVDDLVNITGKPISTDKDISLYTSGLSKETKSYFCISGPGEYEVSEISIAGIPSRSHMDEKGQESNTIYRLLVDDIRVAIIGHAYPDLSEEQLESIGTVDVLIIPVGGNGFTLDSIGASKIVKDIEPKIVIPTNFDDGKTVYEVPAAPLEEALKSLVSEIPEKVDSLKIKNIESMGDVTKVVVLDPKG